MDNVSEWSEFSLVPQTEQALEERLLSNINSVCVTYICRFSVLSEKFIERLLALTTGVLNKESTEEEIQMLTDFMVDKLTNQERDRKKKINIWTMVKDDKGIMVRTYKSFNESNLSDRLDWTYIARFQALSNDFIKKYAKHLEYKDLYANPKLDRKFVVDFAPNLKGYVKKTNKDDLDEDV